MRYGPETETLIPTTGGVFDVAHTLRADGFDASEDGTGRGTPLVAEAFNWQSGGDCRGLGLSATTNALHCGQAPAALNGMVVRRLTPRECERLQALPDDWTLVPRANGKPMQDGPRYKALGNTFTATVIRWIAERINGAHLASQWGAP